MSARETRRVVITGMGAITPLGNSVDEFWRGCTEGRSGIGWITVGDPKDYPVKIDGEVKGFCPTDFMDGSEAASQSRFSQFAVAAASMAIEDARLDVAAERPERIGVIVGTGAGGYAEVEAATRAVIAGHAGSISQDAVAQAMPHMATANIARAFGLKGYANTVCTACAAGTQAIGSALDIIRSGRADIVLAGGTEAGLCEIALAGFVAMRALSTRADDPTRASRPFDARRDGFVSSEGAAMFVLEELEHALARGARIFAELAGYGATSDAFHIVAPRPDGSSAQAAMSLALADAGVAPAEVDYINAHGTSTVFNDVVETAAIKAVFGEDAYRIPVSSTKSQVGHALGAAGAIESVACVKAIQTGILPPTINHEEPDPQCDLDYVPNESRLVGDVRVVLKNSFGFGGQNACLVFRKL
ncbi:MAG TPA: beta-ketoacyl-ACP synthase II [Dehalococcoidia bacterium]|nr:beta-ketoacyl-ACP synthase II [Dehalococcoidia bacterium]